MTETLFTKAGSEPSALPFSDYDENGDVWTNLAENAVGRAACGWEAAPERPAFDPAAATIAWVDGSWVITPIPAEQLAAAVEAFRQAQIAALADYRWQRQQSFSWNGVQMPADTNTIALVSAKVKILEQRGTAENAPFTWKPAPATFVNLTLAQLRAYGDAIDVHVQDCFDREEALCGELLAAPATHEAIAAIDITAGFPE